jgi:O-antigen ligase
MKQTSFLLIKLPLIWQQRIFYWLSYSFAFSIPYPVGFNSTISILLLVAWLFFFQKKISRQKVKYVLAWSTLFLLAVAGLIFTQNFEEAFFRIQQKILLLLLPLVYITTSVDTKEESKGILASFLLGLSLACFVILIVATFRAFANGSTIYFFSKELVETKIIDLYPYILAILCLGSVIILAEHFLNKDILPNFFTVRVTGFLILFFTLIILLLGVKQLFFALVLVLILYTIRINNHKIYVALFIVFVGFTIAVATLPVLRERALEAFAEQDKPNPLDQNPEVAVPLNGIALRRAIWVCASDLVQENFWFGVGTGDAQDELQKSYVKHHFILAAKYNRFNAHNQYLQVILNFGFVGFFIWVISIGWLGYLQRKNSMLLALLGLLFFSMLTESMLETNKGVLAFSFLTLMAYYRSQQKLISISHA